MVRSFRLSLIAILYSLTLTIGASAQLAPEDIKNQVESSSTYTYGYTKTTDQVALNVLAQNSVDTLLGTYSIETIFSWNNGTTFIKSLQSSADETTKVKLSTAFKNYVQKQLKKVWLDDIAITDAPTSFHALSDYENTIKITTDLDTTTYKQQLKSIAPLLCSMVKEEKEFYDKGYFVFFHGQRWEYLFGEKLYTDLWALTKNKNRPKNYLFPHVRVAGLDPEANGKLNRKNLVERDDYNYSILLFTTNSLFGNYRNSSNSSPLSYFLQNNNYGNVRFSLYDIFTHYGITNLYNKYNKEITNLEKHFNKARTFGTILRVAVPKSMINDYCFGQCYDAKKDTRAALENLRKCSGAMDYEAFCIVMLDEAMNPEGRILIKAYHCAEPTEWKKFEEGYEQLIQKLAAEINPPVTPTKKGPASPAKKVAKKK